MQQNAMKQNAMNKSISFGRRVIGDTLRSQTALRRTLANFRVLSFKGTSAALVLALTLGLSQTGCSSVNNAGKGAGVGAAAGAVIGGLIGRKNDETGKGAVIGAVVGGTAGAIIGTQMDKQARELEEELENAKIERVGEGITITMDSAILFDVDSSELREISRDGLEKLAASLLDYPNTDLIVVGHTDNTGRDEYNQQLSEKRAESAAVVLLNNGVAIERISISGRGEAEPIESNDSSLGRQANRRVEIGIFASEEYREQLEKQNN